METASIPFQLVSIQVGPDMATFGNHCLYHVTSLVCCSPMLQMYGGSEVTLFTRKPVHSGFIGHASVVHYCGHLFVINAYLI